MDKECEFAIKRARVSLWSQLLYEQFDFSPRKVMERPRKFGGEELQFLNYVQLNSTILIFYEKGAFSVGFLA